MSEPVVGPRRRQNLRAFELNKKGPRSVVGVDVTSERYPELADAAIESADKARRQVKIAALIVAAQDAYRDLRR